MAAGLAAFDEMDTTCCYARQDKIWVRDPDGTPWEVFATHEDTTAGEGGLRLLSGLRLRRDRLQLRGRRAPNRSAARERRRAPAQRSPDALPALGGLAVVAVGDRPDDRPRAVAGHRATTQRGLIHFALSSLMVAEERITTKFSGLVGAHGSEEEATFLATQQVDEARHMQFYARFQDEVVGEPAVDRRARRAGARAGLRQLPPDLRRRAGRGARAARRRAGGPRGEGPLHHDLPPDPREHARADVVPLHHRLPEASTSCCRASSRATRRSTTTRRATSATASGSCARRCARTRSRPTSCARRCASCCPPSPSR